jgi:hypothetical protein
VILRKAGARAIISWAAVSFPEEPPPEVEAARVFEIRQFFASR